MTTHRDSEGWLEELGRSVADELYGLFEHAAKCTEIPLAHGTEVIASATLVAEAAERTPVVERGLAGSESRSLVRFACAALERVMDSEVSELARIWDAAGPTSPWHAEQGALQARLVATLERQESSVS